MQEDLSQKLQEIEAKIQHEETVLAGFKHMQSAHSKKDFIAQCHDGIKQSETILSYFRKEKSKLLDKMAKAMEVTPKENLNIQSTDLVRNISSLGGSGKLSLLDFRKHNPPLSREMIAYRLQEAQHKLEIEEKVKAAYEKYQGTAQANKELAINESQLEAATKLADSNDRIRIFSFVMRELKPLTLAALDDDEGQQLLKPGLRRPMTGTLKIKLLSEQNLQNVDPLCTVVKLQIDGKLRGTVKLHNLERRLDHFVTKVHKNNEMELLIVNEVRDRPPSLIGMLWIPLAEIADDIRKKNAGKPGWAPADASGEIHRSKTVVRNGEGPEGFEVIEDWFKVEPVGKLLLRIDFAKSNLPKKPPAQLGRQGALRMGKEVVCAEIQGHRFVKRAVYRPLTCAVCHKLTMNSTEYHCQDCRFFCHIACAPESIATCITRSNQEHSKRKDLNKIYNIPHRFESSTALSASWCCHCGQMLSLVRGNGKKCKECHISAHTDCMHFVPNFCGLSKEMAKQLISFDRRTKSTEIKSDLVVKPPLKEVQSQVQIPTVSSTANVNLKDKRASTSALSQGLAPPKTVDTSLAIQPISAIPSTSSQPITLPQEPSNIASITRPVSAIASSSAESIEQGSQVTPTRPSQSINDYVMQTVLGRGNFGKVMLARHRVTLTYVAIKVLKKDVAVENDEVEALRSELHVFVQTTNSENPFLVQLHACFTSPTSIFFVMEYVVGGDLMSLIQRLGKFTPNQARFYTVEVVLALEFLHSRDIIYRDLKLDNIMLTEDGHIKVADYGLCKLNMGPNTTTATFCGTPEFMAPEILSERRYGRSVDWWSLGVLMYQMILGQSPFTGADDTEIFDSIMEDEVLYPLALPRTTVSILERLLTKNPNRRLGSGIQGALEVRNHPYFDGIDFEAYLRKEVQPPYIPTIQNATDTSNFDLEFTSQPAILTPSNSVLQPQQQRLFRGFSFTR